MKIVIAVGGNALLKRGQVLDVDTQRANVRQACKVITRIAKKHDVIITHGNGPQVGLLALQAAAYQELAVYPFDVLSAESQGMIGYLLAQELINQLPRKKVAVLLTQVEVMADDPAFLTPTKFIGPTYTVEEADRLSDKYHWQFANDGEYRRRVIASPMPHRILEIDSIRCFTETKAVVICLGGGGIPVVCDADHHYRGIEAVIDKDFSSRLLAEELKADRLLLLTDVSNVMKNWGTSEATPIGMIHQDELRKMSLPGGSMGPKALAACQFVCHTGRTAHIGLLDQAEEVLEEKVGTIVVP